MIQIIQNKKCKKKKKMSENYWLSRRKHGYLNNSHDNIFMPFTKEWVEHMTRGKIVMMYTQK